MAKNDSPPNPYMGITLSAMYNAMQQRAGQLLKRDTAFATDTAYLLLAAAFDVGSNEASKGTVEHNVMQEGESIVTGFGRYHEAFAKEARYRTLVHATNAAFGGERQFWMRDAWVGGHRVSELALASDEGLHRVLVALEAVRLQRCQRTADGAGDPFTVVGRDSAAGSHP